VSDPGVTITYHLVPAEYYRDCDTSADYIPQSFADEGFIHCTNGEQNVADTANRYYKDDRRMYVVLAIDVDRVKSEVRYEDEAGIYPHIHGSLNRDAIVEVLPILREADGTFLPPSPPR
jgi:uncharacterized protein (DUF952 family)